MGHSHDLSSQPIAGKTCEKFDGAPITIEGLWDEWRDRQAGETIRSCSMIITDANEFVGELHDRMPVMLEPEQLEAWLTGRSRPRNLKPAPTCCNAGRCHGA
jgi:putative SOS response-associated peptidase YedK